MWHRRQAEEGERREQWSAAVFHYDRLLAAHPRDAALAQRRARAVARQGQLRQ